MFIETPRFPDDISAQSVFGPAYFTLLAMNLAGKELRNQNWSSALRKGTIGQEIQDQTQFNALMDFFHVAEGQTHGWRFKDWADFIVNSGQGRLGVLGVSSASATATGSASYQLFKRYVNSANPTLNPKDRAITKPVSGQVSVYRAGVLVAFGAASGQITCDTTTGVITWSASAYPASGEALTWQGQFDVPCRFDTDQMASVTHLINNESWPNIPIIELRL